MFKEVPNCPLCEGLGKNKTFPYSIKYQGQVFDYLKCETCSTSFVNPIPDENTFSLMYSKSDYHDLFYPKCNSKRLRDSVGFLIKFAPKNAKVLDYGCGVGHFLHLIKMCDFEPVGVEYDKEAAKQASDLVGCQVTVPDVFFANPLVDKFDVIHIGDVLEHLPNPSTIIKKLIIHLKPGGILFVEGPLENNPSFVYWSSLAFGTIKHFLSPHSIGHGVPHHLYRTGSDQQKSFFHRIDNRLNVIAWDVYESGWPYADGGLIKKFIASTAKLMSGNCLFEHTFGNRFRGIVVLEA
jgi:SAM-dependent methyltransferase